MFHGAANLVRLVSLACEEDHISLRREVDRPRDRLAAVLDPLLAARRHPGLDVVEDPLWVLRPRIVARDDRQVAAAFGDAPHLGALPTVAVSPAPEDDDEAPGREGPHCRECALERVGG